MRRKQAGPEALGQMREADSKATWRGQYKCCGKEVSGTPKEIAQEIERHLAEGCHGAPNWPDAPASTADR